ncbi:hypothetical protein [Roseateles sp.]|uniref:hypothetical protein n=1 Tax=Roseateles sp. TaxID=1971397 RepID=UPI003D0E695F
MTVIATFGFPDHPMAFGDMLVSGPERTDRKIGIPSIGDVTNFFPEGSGWSITGLAQKLVIVSDECVVGWAGSQLGARMAIHDLRSLASSERLTPASIRHFLDNMNVDTRNLGTSLLGLLRTDAGFERFAFDPSCEATMLDGTPVTLAGSGANTIAKFLSTSRRTRLRQDDSAVHPAEKAYELGLQIAGVHLRMEEAHDAQLLQYFGGLYEVAVFNGERFTKDLGVTYVLWEGKDPDANGFSRPSHIITTNYFDDVLVFRSQKLVWKEGTTFVAGDLQVHSISPIYGRTDPSFRPTPAMVVQQTPWTCHCFLTRRSNGSIRQLAIVQRPNYDGSDNFSIEAREGIVVKVNWKKQFWEDLQFAIEVD